MYTDYVSVNKQGRRFKSANENPHNFLRLTPKCSEKPRKYKNPNNLDIPRVSKVS